MEERRCEVGIIGGGVAALTAGFFLQRQGLHTLMIAQEVGGQTATTAEVENYPGVGRVGGYELVGRFCEQYRANEGSILNDSVDEVFQGGDDFYIEGMVFRVICECVIIACGKRPRLLDVPGEKEFYRRGVSYGYGDGFYREDGDPVVVIGGGNAAAQAVCALSEHGIPSVIVHRGDSLRAEQSLRERLSRLHDVTYYFHSQVREIHGEGHVSHLTIQSVKGTGEFRIPTQSVVIHVGYELALPHLPDTVNQSSGGHIIVNEKNETSLAGVFAAGDCTTVPFAQIVISAGEGAKAALSAYRYLSHKKGRRPLVVDWGFHS